MLAAPFAAAAEELGLGEGASLEYAPRAAGSAAEIRGGPRRAPRRRPEAGPHLLGAAPRRAEARARRQGRCAATARRASSAPALLALIFAEREALMEARAGPAAATARRRDERARPDRRERLVGAPRRGGQTLITAAAEESVPARRGRASCACRLPAAPRSPRHDPPRAPRARRRGALRAALERRAPKTPLAAVQAAWAEAVGERVGGRRGAGLRARGTVVVDCADPVWAAGAGPDAGAASGAPARAARRAGAADFALSCERRWDLVVFIVICRDFC